MAAAELVILSSSPSAVRNDPHPTNLGNGPVPTTTRMCSSPDSELLSPASLLNWRPRPKPTFKTGSRAVPIPEGAVTGFRSANVVAREDEEAVEYLSGKVGGAGSLSAGIDTVGELEDAKDAKKKRARRSDGTKLKLDKKPVVRKPRKKNEAAPGVDQERPAMKSVEDVEAQSKQKEQKVKKPREKKSKAGEQGRLPEGKITKPGVEAEPKSKAFRYLLGVNVTDCTSEHFKTKSVSDAEKPEASNQDEQDKPLVQALNRRRNWTPPRDTVTAKLSISNSLDDGSNSPKEHDAVLEQVQTAFFDLKAQFSFNQQSTKTPLAIASKSHENEPLAKRQRIDIVESVSSLPTFAKPAQPVKKPRSPAKKPMTITALAIAQAQGGVVQDVDKHVTEDPQLRQELQVFGFGASREKASHVLQPESEEVTSKRGAAGKQKLSKTTRKSKKGEIKAAQKLPSPATAMQRIARQDILFGTSSQLATDEDPSYIRNLQLAMKASEADAEPANSPGCAAHCPMPPPGAQNDNKVVKRTHRGLWTAGNRVDDGSLLQPDPLQGRPAFILHMEPAATAVSNLEFADIDLISAEADVQLLAGCRQNVSIAPGAVLESKNRENTGTQRLKLTSGPITQPTSFPATMKRPESPVKNVTVLQGLSPNVSTSMRYASTNSSKGKHNDLVDTEARPITERAASSIREGRDSDTKSNGVADEKPTVPKKPRGRPRKDAVAPSSPKKTEKRKQAGPAENTAAALDTEEVEWPAIDDIDDPDFNAKAVTGEQQLAHKKPRGRPRKTTAASTSPRKTKKRKALDDDSKTVDAVPGEAGEWLAIDDIEDLETGRPTPSPPRRHSPAIAGHLELSQETSIPMEAHTTDPSDAVAAAEAERKAAEKARKAAERRAQRAAERKIQREAEIEAEKKTRRVLLPLITKAIKSEPRTTDPKRPSWFEKILMYDPIVLEDLTAWLNSGPLREAQRAEGVLEEGKDAAEVKAVWVQQWCEEHSVCCLWKGGLRGGVTQAY